MSDVPVSELQRLPNDFAIPDLGQLVVREDPGHHYKYISLIGQGAFGEVYFATDLKKGEKVAIKRMLVNPKNRLVFFLKAGGEGLFLLSCSFCSLLIILLLTLLFLPNSRVHLASEIFLQKETSHHPNVVRYVDGYLQDHHLSVVLEYMDGGSLTQILELFPSVTMTEVSWGRGKKHTKERKERRGGEHSKMTHIFFFFSFPTAPNCLRAPRNPQRSRLLALPPKNSPRY